MTYDIPSDIATGTTYEFRLGSDDTNFRNAKSTSFTVNACSLDNPACASVSVGGVTAVAAGRTLSVSWTNEVAPTIDDYIGLYKVGSGMFPYRSFFQPTNNVAGGSTVL